MNMYFSLRNLGIKEGRCRASIKIPKLATAELKVPKFLREKRINTCSFDK